MGTESRLDYDLHGLIGVRLIDPSPADAAAVADQLGVVQRRPLTREPDVRVRFVERLHTPDLRFVETPRSGFTDEDFILLPGGGGFARARIPFDSLGAGGEIVCERGIGPVPLLLDAVKLVALRKGLVPLHASAFVYGGTGVLVLGWAHGGKTSALLAFTERGAALVGDDLVLLAADGGRMFGIAAPVELCDWQLRQVPRASRRLGLAHRLAARGVAGLDRLQRGIPPGLLRAALPRLRRAVAARVPAEVLSPSLGSCAAAPERLVLMIPHEAGEIRVEVAEPEAIVERAVHLARHEEASLLGLYRSFRFAFPDRRNDLVERAVAIEVERLRGALAGLDAYLVYHPRPVSLRRLFEAMEPLCAAPRRPMAAAAGEAR